MMGGVLLNIFLNWSSSTETWELPHSVSRVLEWQH